MIGYQALSRLLEFLNGAWFICCMSLAIVAAVYLVDSWRRVDRPRCFLLLPQGMRVAVSVLGMATAVAMTRGAIWWWRASGAGELAAPFLMVLLGGAALGCASFLLAIKEFGSGISARGRWASDIPWGLTVAAVIIFVLGSLMAGR